MYLASNNVQRLIFYKTQTKKKNIEMLASHLERSLIKLLLGEICKAFKIY